MARAWCLPRHTAGPHIHGTRASWTRSMLHSALCSSVRPVPLVRRVHRPLPVRPVGALLTAGRLHHVHMDHELSLQSPCASRISDGRWGPMQRVSSSCP